ncbi:MAG: RimK family protein [Acidobacteria bacterium]|nr:RimK family protein [Acidobacteriota bacterium]
MPPSEIRRKSRVIVVLDSPASPPLRSPNTWTADEYLEGKRNTLGQGVAVLNLCNSYQYLSKGYYVSLLADARGQRVLPSVAMIEQINNPFAYFRVLAEAGLDTIDFKLVRRGRSLLPKVIVPEAGASGVLESSSTKQAGGPRYRKSSQVYCEVTSIFGQTLDRRFRRQTSAIFKAYAFPILRVRMYQEDRDWKVGQIFPISLGQLTAPERKLFDQRIDQGRFPLAGGHVDAKRLFRIACLFDPTDPFRPSDVETLEKLERAALRRGVLFESISKDDLSRLPEYDALFIRTVTAIGNDSFMFAQRAESLGIPVIDDPRSIVRCSNKVYLHELFQREGIPTPPTQIISRRTKYEEMEELGLPLIVKLPQGTFSAAVKKANDRAELRAILSEMFKESPLLIVQGFVPTAFDWRICVLEGKILFACKYHQAKGHWQIARKFDSGFTRFGKVEAIALRSVPAAVKRIALQSAALIGDGLYGADIKVTADGPAVIEINDNPNIDTGYEDVVAKDRVYDAIINALLRRIRVELKPPQIT